MRYGLWKGNGMLTVVVAAATIVMLSAASYAGTPILGTGCGSGATVLGSNLAGKVTIGSGSGTCTLRFSTTYAHAPACMAMNETNGGAHAVPAGVKTTTTTLMVDSSAPWAAGDVLAYSCQTY